MTWQRIASSTLLTALAIGCGEQQVPTAPTVPITPSLSIQDGAHGGIAGFYFLPPMVKQPAFGGTFDPRVAPIVEICNDVSCSALHATFTMTSGSGSEVVRMDPVGELYIVNWHTDKTAAVVGKVYRVRVLIDGAVAGFADVVFEGKAKGPKNAATGEAIVTVDGSTLPIKFRVETVRGEGGGGGEPSQPPTCRSCLEVVPGALLFTSTGAQKQLNAYLVDDQGHRTLVAATFESSNTDKITVTPGGLATAVAALGSSQIVAHSGSQTSAPVLALIAAPVAGALLITDDQIDGPIIPVDLTAPYKPGWRYHVHLKGVTPQVGQVVLNTGFAAVGGKVISVTPGAGFSDVVLELLPIGGMFASISIDQHISLRNAPAAINPGALQSLQVEAAPAGGVLLRLPAQRLTPTNVHAVPRTGPARALSGKVEFDLGIFKCEAEVSGGLAFPISLGTVSVSLNPDLTLDLQVDNLSVKRAVAHGTLAPRIDFNPSLTASVEGELECKYKISQIVPPIGGPIAQIIGIQIPYGIGFGVGAKGEVGGMSFDAFMSANVTSSFGLDCLSACTLVSELSSDAGGSFKPSVPSLNLLRTELSLSAFGWAEIHIGNPYIEALQFDLVDVKAALQQKAELATTLAQALDPAYASGFALDVVLEAGNSTELEEAAGLLSISLPELKLEEEIPLSSSPKGTLTVEPSDPEPGDASALGEMTTFKVNLTSSTFVGAYAVEGVEIRWLRTDQNGDPVLEPGRPGCTAIAASFGQTEFTCQTDFLKEHEGDQTFYAFVHANLFGVSVPILLEIAEDSKATVSVTSFGHVHRRVDFTNGNVQETDATPDASLPPSGGGFAGPGAATYHSETNVTNPAGCTIHAVFNGTGTELTVASTGPNTWVLQAQISGTHDDTNLCFGSTQSFPFSVPAVTLAFGKSILRNGVLKGIDFKGNASTSTATVVATGRLKVGN